MKTLPFASLLLGVSLGLTGCQSAAQRLHECEGQGVSHDACYVAEQQRQSAINAAAQKQALENAAALSVQHAQGVHKKTPRTVKGYGVTVKIDGQQLYVDGKPAVLDAIELGNRTFSQGLNTLIVYKSGKVALLQSGRFIGYLK